MGRGVDNRKQKDFQKLFEKFLKSAATTKTHPYKEVQ
jgi:hypothetical protein